MLLSAQDHPVPQVVTKWKHGRIAFFTLGLVCAMLLGVIALAVVLITSPDTARANTQVPAGVTIAEKAAWAQETARDGIASGRCPNVGPHCEGRQLWWKLPQQSIR
jgi:hypothetical protein